MEQCWQTAGNQAGNQAGNAAGNAGRWRRVWWAGGRQWTGRSGGQRHQWREPTHSRAYHAAKDGKFGVVVVGSRWGGVSGDGSSVDWQNWRIRLSAGRGRQNWILQYSLPAPGVASTAMPVARMRPGPYDITRPSIDSTANTDAIMVHGFVNTAGRSEQTGVVFPTALAEAKFLLHALQASGSFRPSMQSGQLPGGSPADHPCRDGIGEFPLSIEPKASCVVKRRWPVLST